jgi:hypothetical protein
MRDSLDERSTTWRATSRDTLRDTDPQIGPTSLGGPVAGVAVHGGPSLRSVQTAALLSENMDNLREFTVVEEE